MKYFASMKFKRCDFKDWPNHGVKCFGHNFCLALKSKVFRKMYYQHVNFGPEC